MSEISPAIQLDFGTGVHPLVDAFRSAAIFVAADSAGRVAGPDLGALEGWLLEWNAWWRRVSGIEERRRLHLMYRREVAVATPIRLQQWPAFSGLGRVCQATGMAWAITLDGHDASRDLPGTIAMLGEGGLHGVALNYEGSDPLPENTLTVATAVLDAGVRVTLVGSMSRFLDAGVLSSSGLNGRHITVEPTLPYAMRDTLDRSEPCFRRFRILVDEEGDIYPCAGLLRMKNLRLGNIAEPFEATVFSSGTAPLDLHALASAGPPIATLVSAGTGTGGLPLLCERHRASFLSSGSSVSGSLNVQRME